MRKLRIPLCVLGLAALVGAPARATHDAPSSAKTVKTDLVRAYAECTTPNDVHDLVTVFAFACSPATPLSAYTFGPQGQGKAQVQLASDGIKFRFAVRDVRTAADAAADGVVFKGRVRIRFTDHGCSAAPSCTVETFFSIDVPCAGGTCSASVVYPDVLFVSGLSGAAEVPQIDVLDDAGNRFATQGILLH